MFSLPMNVSSTRTRTAALLLVLAVALPVATAHAAPATTPTATTFPAKPDFSDPNAAVQSFLNAVTSGDVATVRDAMDVAPAQKPAVDTFLSLIFATTKLQKAVLDRFGDAATQYFGAAGGGDQISDRLAAIAKTPAKISGDSAVLTLPADAANHQPGGTIVVKKINNAWKLDGGNLFMLNSMTPDQIRQRVSLAKALGEVTTQMIADVQAGKFAAPVDAYQEFWNRSLAASKALTTTQPATTQAK